MVVQDRDLDRKLMQEVFGQRLRRPLSPIEKLRRRASRVAPEVVKRGYRRMRVLSGR
jgi:hypothetical protein